MLLISRPAGVLANHRWKRRAVGVVSFLDFSLPAIAESSHAQRCVCSHCYSATNRKTISLMLGDNYVGCLCSARYSSSRNASLRQIGSNARFHRAAQWRA